MKEFGFCRLNDMPHDCVRVIESAEAEFFHEILGVVNFVHTTGPLSWGRNANGDAFRGVSDQRAYAIQ